MKQNIRGFTIMELLVVIAIIGILSTVILVGLGSFRDGGRDARRVSDLHQIQNALELYFAKFSGYPTGVNYGGLVTLITDSRTGLGITRLPNDPVPGRSYKYAGVDTNYVLGADLQVNSSSLLNDGYRGALPSGSTGGDSFSCSAQQTFCLAF